MRKAIFMLFVLFCLIPSVTASGELPRWVKPPVKVKLKLSSGAYFYGKIVRIDKRLLWIEPISAEGASVGQLGIELADVVKVEPLGGKAAKRLKAEAMPAAPAAYGWKSPQKAKAGKTPLPGRILSLEEKALLHIVNQFPPEMGWGEKRIKEIDYRWKMRDLPPNKAERRFKEIYPQWRRGIALREKLEREKEARRKAENKRMEKQDKLVNEFPMDKGWHSKRYQALVGKKAKAMSVLSGKELEFINIYPDLKRGRSLGKGVLRALPEGLSNKTRALVKLVSEWRVTDGWTQEKYDKLKIKKDKAESVLSPDEKRFVEVFQELEKGRERVKEKPSVTTGPPKTP